GAGNRSRAADAAERVLFLFDAGGTLEGESGRRAVPEVPDVTVHALLARSARVDDDRIAAAVRHGHDHTPAARAASFSLPGGTSGARVEGFLEGVVDDGAGRRVRCGEACGSDARPTRAHADLRRLRAEDVEVGRDDFGRELLERGDVV